MDIPGLGLTCMKYMYACYEYAESRTISSSVSYVGCLVTEDPDSDTYDKDPPRLPGQRVVGPCDNRDSSEFTS